MIKETVVTPEEVTPHRVVEAYRETGLNPTRSFTYINIDGSPSGCAIGAIYIKEFGFPEGTSLAIDLYSLEYLQDMLGDTLVFGVGFDNAYAEHGRDERYQENASYGLGYDCGVAVREEFGD